MFTASRDSMKNDVSLEDSAIEFLEDSAENVAISRIKGSLLGIFLFLLAQEPDK